MPTQHENSPAPDFLAHWVVKTARYDQMIAWYCLVFGARVVHEDDLIAFLTWDEVAQVEHLMQDVVTVHCPEPPGSWDSLGS
jgi:hypothetical protein